jgi:hypothetical protein
MLKSGQLRFYLRRKHVRFVPYIYAFKITDKKKNKQSQTNEVFKVDFWSWTVSYIKIFSKFGLGYSRYSAQIRRKEEVSFLFRNGVYDEDWNWNVKLKLLGRLTYDNPKPRKVRLYNTHTLQKLFVGD